MCVFEGSMPPSISVTREQEVWGEYGIYTAHKHKALFKIINKRHLKVSKKEVQIPPKRSARDHPKPKNHSDAAMCALGPGHEHKRQAGGFPTADSSVQPSNVVLPR